MNAASAPWRAENGREGGHPAERFAVSGIWSRTNRPVILYNPVIMKAIATAIVLSASLLVHAQTPAPKSAPAKRSPARTGAAHTLPVPPVPAQPGNAQGQGARGLQGELHHHRRRLRGRSPSRLGAPRRGPFLQPGSQWVFHQRGLLSRRSRLRGAVRVERQPRRQQRLGARHDSG